MDRPSRSTESTAIEEEKSRSHGDPDDRSTVHDVLIVGGGVAGLSAATFTARAGLKTVVATAGESILNRNAHIENFSGFPAGINPRLLLELQRSQASRNGAELRRVRVVSLERVNSGEETEGDDAPDRNARFVATIEPERPASESGVEGNTTPEADGDRRTIAADHVIAASWSDASYLEPAGTDLRDAGSKTYVQDDGHGRTSIDGLYAAGRLAEQYHQAIVAAGDGARTAITLIHDADVPFYHDWVTPEGYFTDRGREVPPGCVEISEAERSARERESIAVMREYFEEPHHEPQRTHPSLVEDELGRLSEE
ncbi:NAD(P)/FAD-dependent oxidoreductase [Halopenitus sp. H-Gu1]|uniref:NAD(P)/FAD-dependent oxidoreductase n=1 Tax=Halopenitus sp. H-Gu1 TaxID=3242697 RepID=UPI00359DFC12